MSRMSLRNCKLTRQHRIHIVQPQHPLPDTPVRGQCLCAPEVGSKFVMLVAPDNTLTQTSPVEHIERDAQGVYFRTRNSVYQLVWED